MIFLAPINNYGRFHTRFFFAKPKFLVYFFLPYYVSSWEVQGGKNQAYAKNPPYFFNLNYSARSLYVMKIEIWCEGTSIHGEHLTDVVAVRVPPDIKVIDSKACEELLKRRRQRIYEANKYRVEYNSRLKNQIERDIFGKKNLVEKLYTIHIKGWSPIITTSALEFICQRL